MFLAKFFLLTISSEIDHWRGEKEQRKRTFPPMKTLSLKETALQNHKLWYERFFSVESNGEGPRSKFKREDGQTDGQKWPKNLGWRRRAAGMSHWCQASAVRGCVPILINPEFDAALDRDSLIMNDLTWVSFVVHRHLTIFFFFFLSFRECYLTRQWQSTECDTRYMVQRKKFDVILRFLVDRYRRTKPPKPDASQFVVPARLPKPVKGKGGLSSSWFDDDVPEVKCTWTASFSWRVKEAALWFKSYGSKNLTGGTWSSQSTSTDWLTRTHHWSSPRSKLAYKKPTSTRKLRKFPVTSGQGSKHRDCTGLRHDDERESPRWRSQSSSCQHHVITWRGLIPADHEYLDSVAWPCLDCEVAPVWHHGVTNARTCQFFRRLFDRLPVRISTSDLHHRILRKKLYHIRAYDFGVQFSFKYVALITSEYSVKWSLANVNNTPWRMSGKLNGQCNVCTWTCIGF